MGSGNEIREPNKKCYRLVPNIKMNDFQSKYNFEKSDGGVIEDLKIKSYTRHNGEEQQKKRYLLEEI